MGLPWYEKRVVPSGIRPLPWVARTATHRLVLPDLQNRHSPHSAVYRGMTWSPGATLVTPSPTSTTMPAPSCPSTAGNTPSGSSPLRVKASVWQTPVWVIRIRTSPLRGGSTSISTICRGLPASKATAARDFIALSPIRSGPMGFRADYGQKRAARQTGLCMPLGFVWHRTVRRGLSCVPPAPPRGLHAARIRLAQDSPQGTVLCPASSQQQRVHAFDEGGRVFQGGAFGQHGLVQQQFGPVAERLVGLRLQALDQGVLRVHFQDRLDLGGILAGGLQ